MTAHPAFRHGRMLSRKKRVSRLQHSKKGHNKIDALNHSIGEHFNWKVFTLKRICLAVIASSGKFASSKSGALESLLTAQFCKDKTVNH